MNMLRVLALAFSTLLPPDHPWKQPLADCPATVGQMIARAIVWEFDRQSAWAKREIRRAEADAQRIERELRRLREETRRQIEEARKLEESKKKLELPPPR